MTLVLVRKLVRDVRLPLLVVMLLLGGFQVLWVKATQRVYLGGSDGTRLQFRVVE